MFKLKTKVYDRNKKHFQKLTKVQDPKRMPELSLRPVNHTISRNAIKNRPLPDASMRFSNSEILKLKMPIRDLITKLPNLKVSDAMNIKSKEVTIGYKADLIKNLTRNQAKAKLDNFIKEAFTKKLT